MFSFFVCLKLCVVSIFLDPTVIAGNYEVLEVVVGEGALNILDVFVFAAWEYFIPLILSRAIVFFRLTFIVPDMEIFDVSLLMAKKLNLSNFTAKMLVAPFDNVIAFGLLELWARVAR